MTDHDAIAARARDHIARGGSPYIAPSEYLDLYDEVKRLRAERDRFEAALGRACQVGGTTYLVERAEKAEAEVARLTEQRDLAIALAEKAQDRQIELADRLDALRAEIAALRKAADALAAFVDEFAAAHIRPLPIPHVRHPADEPDQVVDAETVWAWQSDAAVALAAYRGKGE